MGLEATKHSENSDLRPRPCEFRTFRNGNDYGSYSILDNKLTVYPRLLGNLYDKCPLAKHGTYHLLTFQLDSNLCNAKTYRPVTNA